MSLRLLIIPFIAFIVSNAFAASANKVPNGIECKTDNPAVEGDLFVIRLEKGAVPQAPDFYVLSRIREIQVGEEKTLIVPETENIAFELTCDQNGFTASCREVSTNAEVNIRSEIEDGQDGVVKINVDQNSKTIRQWEFNQSKNQCKVLYK